MLNKKCKIRPYARLVTMLGEQLIKNEVIALSELIKNSYDADASWVKISFCNFDGYSITPESKIIIQDNGIGMNQEVIEKSWLNPATPMKLKQKEENPKTKKGRILQGEKGIGRFAIFKLGSYIKITSKTEQDQYQNVVTYDFTKYDSDFTKENNQEKELFIDDLEVDFEQTLPLDFTNEKEISFGAVKKPMEFHGTKIEISNLKYDWSEYKIKKVQADIGKMLPIFEAKNNTDFEVKFYVNGKDNCNDIEYNERLINILDEKAVFKITNGHYNESEKCLSFLVNNSERKLYLHSEEIKALSYYKNNSELLNETMCGDFDFKFYIFDLNANYESKYYLDKDDKELIRNHRVYLYRDDVRVLPYGDSDDDWLKIDMTRGTKSFSEFVGNDQTVGCIYITQKNNPLLKDKTNREGLIDDGVALNQFITILQIVLNYIRKKDYAQYIIDNKRKKEHEDLKEGKPIAFFENLKQNFENDEKSLGKILACEKAYKNERDILQRRIDTVESLAGVGLSVETASHDIMLFIDRTCEILANLYKALCSDENIDIKNVKDKIELSLGNMSLVKENIKNMQILFPSSKRKVKMIDVKSIVDNVYSIYKEALDAFKISVNIRQTTNPLRIKIADAVLMQALINLFDNSLYWLKNTSCSKQIEIFLDGENNRLVFSDSGPGISDNDKNYVFEAFYSGKGQEGRGLGLYIARQLLEKYDYTIELAEFSKDRLLSGANFVLDFVCEE